MENILLSGIQAQWLRAHNIFARELASIRPDWRSNDNILYEEAKKILSGVHQHYIYDEWLPILIGKEKTQQYVGDNGLFSRYNPTMPGVIFNEAVTAVLRLHTLVRDLYSRCKPNGQLIDQVWLHDINAKCNLAYDAQNNGVDSFLCGALFDFGFSGDTNYAQEIHHRLFETMNAQGQPRRNDIVSINICRAREHGIPGYNAYRQLCGLRRAVQFQDFADVMSPDAIQKLSTLYNDVEDVDLFVGVNHENHLPGALVGPVSACIIGIQFKHLKYGDRLFYSHEGQFTAEQLTSIKKYSYNCFICHTTDIEKVPLNPFRPPNDMTNPLGLCSQCPIFDFAPWRLDSRNFG
jgi:peroxidase